MSTLQLKKKLLLKKKKLLETNKINTNITKESIEANYELKSFRGYRSIL